MEIPKKLKNYTLKLTLFKKLNSCVKEIRKEKGEKRDHRQIKVNSQLSMLIEEGKGEVKQIKETHILLKNTLANT